MQTSLFVMCKAHEGNCGVCSAACARLDVTHSLPVFQHKHITLYLLMITKEHQLYIVNPLAILRINIKQLLVFILRPNSCGMPGSAGSSNLAFWLMVKHTKKLPFHHSASSQDHPGCCEIITKNELRCHNCLHCMERCTEWLLICSEI